MKNAPPIHAHPGINREADNPAINASVVIMVSNPLLRVTLDKIQGNNSAIDNNHKAVAREKDTRQTKVQNETASKAYARGTNHEIGTQINPNKNMISKLSIITDILPTKGLNFS